MHSGLYKTTPYKTQVLLRIDMHTAKHITNGLFVLSLFQSFYHMRKQLNYLFNIHILRYIHSTAILTVYAQHAYYAFYPFLTENSSNTHTQTYDQTGKLLENVLILSKSILTNTNVIVKLVM